MQRTGRHNYFAATRNRHEQFVYRKIEANRSRSENPCKLFGLEKRPGPVHERSRTAMLDRHTFRHSRRTRGVDDISEMIFYHPAGRVSAAFLSNLWPLRVEADLTR